MKLFAAIILTFFVQTSLVLAHDMEGGSTKGLFGLKAEYIHVLINPLPVYGLAMGAFVLCAGLITRSRAARNIGLVLIFLCGASAWPVFHFGENGYNHLFPQLDTDSQRWLKIHMERAELFIYFFIATALVSFIPLFIEKQSPRAARFLTYCALVGAVVSAGLGGWISRAGGEASHSEFRSEELPSSPSGHHEQGMAMSNSSATHEHDSPMTNEAHQHAFMPQIAEKSVLPSTTEGLWTEIQKRRQELNVLVKEKKAAQIHQPVAELQQLIKGLVDLSHPDHKAAVQAGSDKAARAFDNLHKSAESTNLSGMDTNFTRFDEALKQLQEKMNKQ